jgi:hypothetical protein
MRSARHEAPAPPAGGEANMAEAYCVKCKAKREVKDAQHVTMKNGKPALKGTCPVCGTAVFKIGG